MLQTASLRRPDLGDRRTQLALGGVAIGVVIAAFAVAIGTGDLSLTLLLAGLGCIPVLVALAIRRPYLFPYGLYIALVPFDNILKLGSAGTLTKLLGIFAAVAVIVYTVRRRGLVKPPLALYVWVLFLAWSLISVTWAPDTDNMHIAIQQMLSVIGMYLVFAMAPVDEHELRGICGAFVAGGILASCFGMYLLHQMPHMTGDQGRLMIDVGNRTIDPNAFANSLLAPLTIAVVSMLHARSAGRFLLSASALVVILAGILMSLSREALLACVVIAAVLVWFSRRRVLGFALAIPAVALIPVFVPAIAQRMAESFSTGGAGRTSIWRVGWLSFSQHPIFGSGLGSALDMYNQNYLLVYQLYNAGWDRPPHNSPLHVAIELGAIGLAMLCVAYFVTFRQMHGIERGDQLYDLRVAFTASLVALGIVSLFIDLTIYKYLWIVLIGIAQLRSVALRRRHGAVTVELAEPVPRPRPLMHRRAEAPL